MGPIELTQTERELWDQICFVPPAGGVDHNKLRTSVEPAFRLTRSLIKRNAIPIVRLRYFGDPGLNVGGHGKSRMQVFERNGCCGDAIFKHPHFHPYLRYFVVGPDLPASTITAFTQLADTCGMITSGDCEAFCDLARQETRRSGLPKHRAAEEFFKLSLELGLDDGMSRVVRDSVMRMKCRP